MLFHGSYTALLTPFKDNKVDFDAYRKLIDFQIENGTNGLVPVGTTGESPTLSHDEHKKLVEVCVEQSNGRVPVIAGAGSNSTIEAIDFVKHACAAGADGLFSQPFFDTKLLTSYLNTFSHTAFFCGVSPVTSPQSKTYWETVNHVTFVESFECTLEYHAQLGKDLLAVSKQFKQHAYLMPIRTPVETYLTLLFS